MPDVTFNEAVYEELVTKTGTEAIMIVGERIVEMAKPLTPVLRTRKPGKREWYYSLPRGRLRESIALNMIAPWTRAAVGEIVAAVPLGRFRNIGGKGRAAYGTRGDDPALLTALEEQRGRPIP